MPIPFLINQPTEFTPLRSPAIANVVFRKLPKGTTNPTGVLLVVYSTASAIDLMRPPCKPLPGKVDQFTEAVSRIVRWAAFSSTLILNLSEAISTAAQLRLCG